MIDTGSFMSERPMAEMRHSSSVVSGKGRTGEDV
jgi:hypothetical protein